MGLQERLHTLRLLVYREVTAVAHHQGGQTNCCIHLSVTALNVHKIMVTRYPTRKNAYTSHAEMRDD